MKPKSRKAFTLSALSLAVSAVLMPNAIYAQEQEQQDETADVERVVITGSRLARDPNLASPSPIQAISSEDIQTSGEFNVSDVVNDIPALFSSQTSDQSNSNNGTPFADGANILNLRGLGADRTLVLVNGRRHVGGAQGSGAVDVGSIPVKLIKSVEVLTGGAAAVYGADAVTGVVNFILDDEFEGFDFDVRVGSSTKGDSEQYNLSSTYGFNFDNDRGNFAVSLEYGKDEGLRARERPGGVFIGSGRDWVNPAKRFQQGDINAADFPNFAQFYNPSNGLPTYGLRVPNANDFISDFTSAFGSAPNLTQAELNFISNAEAAPARAVLPGRTFPFTSGYGYIIPGNPFTFDGFDPNTPIDLDGNGVNDCLDSFTGFNSVGGIIGGCWNVTENGTYRPVQDGLVASGGQGFGGDSFNTIQQENGFVLIPAENINLNLLSSYDVTDDVRVTGELKYSRQTVDNIAQPTSFWDLLLGAPDNPFLPAFIRPLAEQTGGVAITLDAIGLGGGETENKRETIRAVLALDGIMDNGWDYSVSAVYGKFERTATRNNSVVVDRFMAAIDAVTDPATGQPACRVDVDPSAPAQGTPFNIPNYDPGYFSFTPGSGQCVPLNIWAGATGITQEALDFATMQERDEIELDQLVISGYLAGDSSDYFELPSGAISFVVGGEYREEESTAVFDDFQRGIIPEGSILPAGSNVADVSNNANLNFRPAFATRNEVGEYDVWEVFAEVGIPLLDGAFLAEELTLELAGRYSDYSTIGNTTTWSGKLLWAPIEDLRLRTNLSRTVRAPNVTELFGPEIGTNFRPVDPCDAAQINALRDEGLAELANNTQANCVADFATIGLDPFDADGNYNFADPLSASFGGIQSGNPDLQEETADTLTVGFVYTPEWFEGFTFSLDYWDIELEDAINNVSGQNIADGCYQGNNLNPAFCDLIGRNNDANSIFFGGFNFIRQTAINFAKRETSGYDFAFGYDFTIGEHDFNARIAGTYVDELNDFNNPLDLDDVDPELGEIRRPELAGNINLTWKYDNIRVGWQTQYFDEMLLGFLEIETAEALYGPSVIQDETWVHDINFTIDVDDSFQIYGGVNNLGDEQPFITNFAYPVSARGRYAFLGVNYRI